jgi:hypothetical protein
MNREAIVRRTGKCYEYPSGSRALHNVVFFPFCTALFVFSLYLLIKGIAESNRDVLGGIIGILFSGSMLVALVYNYFNLGSIVVNDREITSLKRGGPVTISWSEIGQIYYIIHPGNNIPDPFFTVYVFSKNRKFIVLDREIAGIGELMDTIRQYADTSGAKEITFSELTKVLLRHYLSKHRTAS